jgi:catechol 2,3-dioxygenase-like lactoylglutathione lyase family enzyme
VHLDNINIDLLEYEEPKSDKAFYSNEQITAMHLCFEVDDFDEAVERLKPAGVPFLGRRSLLNKMTV